MVSGREALQRFFHLSLVFRPPEFELSAKKGKTNMATTTQVRSDEAIREDVLLELKSNPKIKSKTASL